MSRLAALSLLLAPLALGCKEPEPEVKPKATIQAAKKADAKAEAKAETKEEAKKKKERPKKSREEIATEVREAMDLDTDPCQDFYQYACGGWMQKTELPSDQARWTRSFAVLREKNRETLRVLLEEAEQDPGDNKDKIKLAHFYKSCMDEDAVEKGGTAPLKPLLDEIAKVEDPVSFMAMTGKLQAMGVRPLFRLGVGPDDKNPGTNIAHVRQGGLGLPDRDYYFDKKRAEIRTAYQAHVAKMLSLLGDPEEEAKKAAERIMALETKLAKLHMDRAERRDPNKTYHKIDIDGLRSQVPKLDWSAYLEGTGHPEVKDINVDSVDYLKGAAKVLAKTDAATLRDYLRWNVARSFSDELPMAFVEESFAFYGKTLQGQDKLEVRWKRCTSATNDAFRHPLGRLYVEREFAGESKTIALDLIQRIEAAFEGSLPKLAWMDDTTRERATEKMKAIYNKVGYPDKWRSYDGLVVTPDDLFANTVASRKFEHEYEMQKIGKPVDRDEWRAGPPVVNASYDETRNEMWFPAGILQAPFFDMDHPMAMNFGGIGVVMGHELTHGFDDQGRKYDGNGVLREWWEKDVIKRFEQRTQCVQDLYGKLEVEPGHGLNGKLTLGENVADMGGVKQAYLAYRKWAEEHEGDAKPHVEGLTNDQLLFVAFAQVWCEVSTPEYLRVQVATDPHSPARFRGSIPLTMTPEFAEAFSCEPETPMNPKDRCEVW